MRKINKLIKSVISILMAFVFIFSVGCANTDNGNNNTATIVPRPPVAKELSLKQSSLAMTVGDEYPLEINKYDRDSQNPVQWASSDESVAKIELIENGEIFTLVNVVAVGEGTANIVVTQGELSASCQVASTFGEKSAMVVLPVEDEFNIQQNKTFKFEPRISFNGKEFDDGEFTYSVADTDNFSINQDGELTGLSSGKSTDVTIEGTWRTKDSDDMSMLSKTVKVTVIDSITLFIDEYSVDYAKLYTIDNFDGKTYTNSIAFTPVVYVNDEIKEDAQISVTPSDDKVSYESNRIIGQKSGISTVVVSYTHDDGTVIPITFNFEVVRPTAHYEQTIEYFSSYSGLFRDKNDSYKEKSIIEYLFPGQSIEECDAKSDGVSLEISSGKVLGVIPDKAGTCIKTLEVGSTKAIYTVDVVVYGQYVYEAKDLDVFRRSVKNIAYDGYVELGRNIDASGYTAGLHFQGDPHSSSNYPQSSSYQEFSGPSYYGGTFDGKGYTISNLTVSYLPDLKIPTSNEKGAVYGMFCALKDATIKNVGFMNADVKGRTMLAFYSQNTTLENVRVDSKTLTKQYYYNSNLLFYAAIVGGSLKNVYITLPSTIEIKTGSGHTGYFAGALAPLPATGKIASPTFENVVVISKLPLGVSMRVTTSAMILYASNDTEEFKTTFNQHYWTRYGGTTMVSTIKSDWKAQADYDATITDYRMLERTKYKNQAPEGTYRFDTVSVLKADTSIGAVLSQFPTEYWTVSNGELVWGAAN